MCTLGNSVGPFELILSAKSRYAQTQRQTAGQRRGPCAYRPCEWLAPVVVGAAAAGVVVGGGGGG